MKILNMLLSGAAALPACLFGQNPTDSVADKWEQELTLNEVVVVAKRPVLKHEPDRIVYVIKNDPYAQGLNGLQLLDRMPRLSVVNERICVAGKSTIRYIIDGHLLEMPEESVMLILSNLQTSGVEKIELLTTPPAKYPASDNVAYISITTRNETHGTRGSLWGSGTVREDVSYQAGGNISYTGRRVEVSADLSWQNTKGINDLTRTYMFADHVRISERSTDFTNRPFGVNGLLRYKMGRGLSAGAIVNFSSLSMKSELVDKTTAPGYVSTSHTISPARPNTSLTLTAFADWDIDSGGKKLSFTYNFYDRNARTFSDVTTWTGESTVKRLTDAGSDQYRIHSVKVDAVLPFRPLKMEAGVAYTDIANHSGLEINEFVYKDSRQSNVFDYDERTAAVYLSAEKQFDRLFYGKVGLRYEYTDVNGHQAVESLIHDKGYGYLLPAVSLSCNLPSAGRLSLSYSMGLTRPGFRNLNPFRYYTTVSDYYSGNPYLRAGKSHNAELNYSLNGIYAVLYNSYNRDAVAVVTRFDAEGNQYSTPENCLTTDKAGLYASYNRSLFSWWNIKAGGEVFYSSAASGISDFRDVDSHGWSGKLELNTSWMLNRQRSLILNLTFSHYFPWHDAMMHYSSLTLMSCELRYALLGGRLNLALSVRDPFGWNRTVYKAAYRDYMSEIKNDIHSHAVALRVAWTFGGEKVNNVYRDTKERESQRTN